MKLQNGPLDARCCNWSGHWRQKPLLMQRRFYGMNYYERQALREKNKATRIQKEDRKQDTVERLREFILIIEDAFAPEAAALEKRILEHWAKAFARCQKFDFDYYSVGNDLTSFDLKNTPKPSRPTSDDKEAWSKFKVEAFAYAYAHRTWKKSVEKFLVTRGIKTLSAFQLESTQAAERILESNKKKLFEMVAKKLEDYQTVEVLSKQLVTAAELGFTGNFQLQTDKGLVWFETKCVPVQGEIKEWHYRYIGHIKQPKDVKAK